MNTLSAFLAENALTVEHVKFPASTRFGYRQFFASETTLAVCKTNRIALPRFLKM